MSARNRTTLSDPPLTQRHAAAKKQTLLSDPLLPQRDAAAWLSVSPRTLWTLTKNGNIPTIRIGRLTLYDPVDLRAYRDKCRLALSEQPNNPHANQERNAPDTTRLDPFCGLPISIGDGDKTARLRKMLLELLDAITDSDDEAKS